MMFNMMNHFYRTACIACSVSNEKAVCPSVCLSNARTVKKWKKDPSTFLYHMKDHFSLIFCEKEWLVGGDPFYRKFWINRPPLERNCRFLTDICL